MTAPYYVQISEGAVRDLAASLADWFSAGEVCREFGVSYATARRYLQPLVEVGTLERRGVTKGTRYRHTKPEPEKGPRSRPRHDHTPSRQHDGAVQVDFTGKKKGESKSNLDRKRKRAGHHLKRGRKGT